MPSLVIDKQIRELLLQRLDLWTITNLNVRIRRVVERVILVIILGTVESFQRRNLSDDLSRKYFRFVQLLDISTCHSPLFVTNIENRGTIRSSHVWSLPVKLCRIVSYGKEDAQ